MFDHPLLTTDALTRIYGYTKHYPWAQGPGRGEYVSSCAWTGWELAEQGRFRDACLYYRKAIEALGAWVFEVQKIAIGNWRAMSGPPSDREIFDAWWRELKRRWPSAQAPPPGG